MAIRDRAEGVEAVTCRIIEVLGDEFDFMAFNGQFRVDQQSPGPAHGFAGFYAGNIAKLVTGIGIEHDHVPPCESDRLTNTWGYPVWIKAKTVVNEGDADVPGRTSYSWGLTTFAHEIAHTWAANASYLADGERRAMTDRGVGAGVHWVLGLHASAPFPWLGEHNGSVMGGAHWRENGDGTYTPTVGWWTKGGGFSWLDLYLMGLATPDEVPDMFMLHDLEQVGDRHDGPYTAQKEIVTIEQVIAATGTRNPPPEQARTAFNVGFVYFLLPGQEPDPELLREHARYRDRAVEHWRHITGGRGRLTTRIPGRYDYGDTYRTESFDLNRGAFNARGMAYANGRFYVADISDGKVYAYSATGERDEAAEFDLHGDNANPEDIAFVNGKLYVLDNADDKLYAYSVTGVRAQAAEFDLHGDNGGSTGIVYANGRFHVLDVAGRVYAYSVSRRARRNAGIRLAREQYQPLRHRLGRRQVLRSRWARRQGVCLFGKRRAR